MGVEAYNFVSALNCILAQRLVRTICEYCAHTVYYDDETLAIAALMWTNGAALGFARAQAAWNAEEQATAAVPQFTSCWI